MLCPVGGTDKLLNNSITWGRDRGEVAECQRIYNRKTDTISGFWGRPPGKSELSEKEQGLDKQREQGSRLAGTGDSTRKGDAALSASLSLTDSDLSSSPQPSAAQILLGSWRKS